VGDQHQGAAIFLQPLFQPQDGIEVEVIGGLVLLVAGLPLPFSPVMPIFSPRYRLKVACSKSTRVPRRMEMSEKFSMAEAFYW
jgi:hypothetical protein